MNSYISGKSRSLNEKGFKANFASADLTGFIKASDKEAETILANCNTKILLNEDRLVREVCSGK